MKRKTYKNFLKVMAVLQNEKHYPKIEAEDLARLVFENMEEDRGRGNHDVEFFLSKILTREEFVTEYGL